MTAYRVIFHAESNGDIFNRSSLRKSVFKRLLLQFLPCFLFFSEENFSCCD